MPPYKKRRITPTNFNSYGGKFTKGKAVGNRPWGKLQTPKYLTALANPFDPKAYGARIPDASTIPSQSFYALDTATLAVYAAGGCGLLFVPMLGSLGGTMSVTGGTTWTWGATYATNNIGVAGGAPSIFANAKTNYVAVRPVASGMKLTAVQNVTAVQGTVHVCYTPISTYTSATWAGPLTVSEMQRCEGYKRYPLSEFSQKPLILTNKPMDVTSQRYVDPIGNTPVSTPYGSFDFMDQWCGIVIFIEAAGSNGTVVVEAEFLTHFEGIVQSVQAGIIPTGQDAEPYNPTLLGVAAHQSASQRIDEPMYHDSGWDNLAVKALASFEGAVGGASSGFGAFGIPGAIAGGAYGALKGFVSGGSRSLQKLKNQRRARRDATSPYQRQRPLLGY